jgi:hypothetical protein
MSPIIKTTITFSSLLAIINLIAGAVHHYLLQSANIDPIENLFFRAYIVNFLLALMIFIILQLAKKRFVTSLGFIYMAGSLIKFTGFFIFFYPTYHADGNVGKPEFLTFFVPYSVCLAFETYYLVQMLNRPES